jgi:DNA relaxase NicK
MTLQDDFHSLSARAKEADERVEAAKNKADTDLEHDVHKARESADKQADRLRKSADTNDAKISAWWEKVGDDWHDHVATVRKNVADKRSAHDLKEAQRAADEAGDDAAYAISYATAAVDEAQYAVLQATLARKRADELASGTG